MFARIPNVFAQTIELVIKGGRVIDPSIGLDAVRDVAIAGGRIIAVEQDIAASATDVIDARGKIVAPGLIDIHSHAGRTKEGPPLCLQDGVTGWVDAGSAGRQHRQRRRRCAGHAANRPRAGEHFAYRRRQRCR
jgi:dihydroorotase